jgi:hypothetical protein
MYLENAQNKEYCFIKMFAFEECLFQCHDELFLLKGNAILMYIH